ncbi:putative holin-like toxin [Catenibacterium sp.]
MTTYEIIMIMLTCLTLIISLLTLVVRLLLIIIDKNAKKITTSLLGKVLR